MPSNITLLCQWLSMMDFYCATSGRSHLKNSCSGRCVSVLLMVRNKYEVYYKDLALENTITIILSSGQDPCGFWRICHYYKYIKTSFLIGVARFRDQGRRTRKSGVTSHKSLFNQTNRKSQNVNKAGCLFFVGSGLSLLRCFSLSCMRARDRPLSSFSLGLRAFSSLSDNHWN